MVTSKLDKLGEVSRLGFGCMRLPILENGKIDYPAAQKMVDLAIASGVNYFDTAYGYHNEESQYFVGEALSKYPRESVYIATKLPIWQCATLGDVKKTFATQLERCRVDYFDVYLVHALNAERSPLLESAGAYKYLVEQKKAGVIKQLGFSYHGDFDTFKRLINEYEWDIVQIQMNYIDYALNDGKAYCDLLEQKGIPCIVMEPVRGGFLANPPEAAKKEMTDFDGGKGSPASWALRWCMNHDNMKIILSGMSNLEQVKDNLATFSTGRKLTADEAAMLDRVRDAILSIKTIPCTGCAYCMDCSFGVNIPKVFDIYNQYMLFNNAFRTGVNYKEMITAGNDAGVCAACGACVPMCPQGIDIPARLAEVHKVLTAL